METLQQALPCSVSLRQLLRCEGRFPVVTFAIAFIAGLLQVRPDLAEIMTFDRTAIVAGEYWRCVAGHFTHWSADHFFWDVLMFVVLGVVVETRSRGAFLVTVVASAVVISTAVWFGSAEIATYRGLSGIDSALFTLAIAMLLEEAIRNRQPKVAWGLVALSVGFAGKILWEQCMGSTVFVDSSAAGFTPLPSVHAVGGAAGALVWLMSRHSSPASAKA